MAKPISRNRGATINASQKTAHENVFYLEEKRPFFPKQMVVPSKISYSPKSVYWYQCLSV